MHPIIREIADNDRAHDPWGACLEALGAVCDVLWHEDGEIPDEAGYSPGMGGPIVTEHESGEGYHAAMLMAALYPHLHPGYWVDGFDPSMELADLEHAARVLSRYADLLKMAGRDY